MERLIVLVSGPVAVGKSTLCDGLIRQHDFDVFKTREYLMKLAHDSVAHRSRLQTFGQLLDKKRDGEWVCDGVHEMVDNNPGARLVVDAVRIEPQIRAIRRSFGPAVFHIHLRAPQRTLVSRYKGRVSKVKEMRSYDEVRKNRTEMKVDELTMLADLVIDTSRVAPGAVVSAVSSYLNLGHR
jgi:adenylosuccinate synthase